MELLKKVILVSCLLSVVLSLADALKPDDKFKHQLKFIFSAVFLTAVITTFAGSDFELDIPVSAGSESLEGYEEIEAAADRTVLGSAQASLNDMISRILTSKGISFKKISADVNMTEDGSININWIGYCGDDIEGAREVIKRNIGEVEVKELE